MPRSTRIFKKRKPVRRSTKLDFSKPKEASQIPTEKSGLKICSGEMFTSNEEDHSNFESDTKMAPKYKVSYFAIKALAEPIRFMLSYLGEDFEDFRYDKEEWLKTIKNTTPFGKCPVLTVDGKDLCQSKAITRYLGRKAGLAGKDDWEDLQIDMMVDVIDDFRIELGKYYWEADEKVKASLKDPLFSTTVPFYMKKLDAVVKSNNGFLANKRLSWGDIWFAGVIDYLSCMYGSDIAADYPNVKALLLNVSSQPKIKAWIDKRPATDM